MVASSHDSRGDVSIIRGCMAAMAVIMARLQANRRRGERVRKGYSRHSGQLYSNGQSIPPPRRLSHGFFGTGRTVLGSSGWGTATDASSLTTSGGRHGEGRGARELAARGGAPS